MSWKVLIVTSIIILEILTISLLWKPTLPLTVNIVRVYDVGDVGYWDVVCLNVTNHGNSRFTLFSYLTCSVVRRGGSFQVRSWPMHLTIAH